MFLKLIGALFIVAGIVIPMVQMQLAFNAANLVASSRDGGGQAVAQAMPGIMAWTVPSNVLPPILLVAGVALLVGGRKKTVRG